MDPFVGFQVLGLMMPLKTDAHFEILLFGFLVGGQNAAHTGGIGRQGLFQKSMFALGLTASSKWKGRNPGGRGQNNDIGRGNRFFVGIQSDKLLHCGRLDFVRLLSLQGLARLDFSRPSKVSAIATI